jgi:apoptosis-inducing factor 2
MPETRHIVFLGASYAGLSASHYFLRHVYPHLPKDQGVQYQALIIDVSSKWYARHASPRGMLGIDQIPLSKMFYDIEPGFEQYGSDKVKFLQGKAIKWDDKSRTLTVRRPNGELETISYWALVLATGTRTYSPLYSLQGNDYSEIEDALKRTQAQLRTAKHILIVGGGPSGVETAGEIGEHLNGAAGWFSSSPSNPKAKITLITSSSKLLPQLRQAISDTAEKYLNRVGVNVRYNTKLSSQESLGDGRTKVILHDGEEIETDLFIPAMGTLPLSEYVPDHLKDPAGYVIQNDTTLRVEKAGPRVYAVGDVGTASDNTLPTVMYSVPVLETNLKRDLLAAHKDAAAAATGKDRTFKRIDKELQIVPIGRSKGVGAIFGWRLPSK